MRTIWHDEEYMPVFLHKVYCTMETGKIFMINSISSQHEEIIRVIIHFTDGTTRHYYF